MEPSIEKFDFQATLRSVGDAVVSVICHILFDFAIVGLGVALVLTICAVVLNKRQHHFSRPFFAVARRIATACAALAIPGCGYLVFTGHLPASGVYLNFAFGFLVLWTMVTIYLCAEEMNFAWFTRGDASPQEIDDEEGTVSLTEPTRLKNQRDVTPELSQGEEAAVGDVTLKLSRDEETKEGDVTLKISRQEETPIGDVTLKLPRDEESVGDVTVKIERDGENVRSRNELGHELPEGDIALRS